MQNPEPDCIILLVGNKLDLWKSEVFTEENNLLFIETSALTYYTVNEAFEYLLQGTIS